jgi:NAD(P)-dependent dehydrogenase (short-subunit alcohol dehydrogenase family)
MPGRAAIVTGASPGIGFALADLLGGRAGLDGAACER